MHFYERPHLYLAMFSIGLKNTLAYKADYFMTLVARFAQAGLMIFIWTAIYQFTNTSSILGVTLPMMYIYFFLVYAFRSVINMSMPDVMQDDILEGSVAVAYTRPVRYPLQVFMNAFSDDLLLVLLVTLPLLLIAYALFGGTISVATALLITAELAIGYAIATVIGFMIGMLAVKLTNIYGIINSIWSAVLLLGGGIMPLSLFPGIVLHVLLLTPFPIMLYMPAATFLGMESSSVIATNIEISLLWLAALVAIASFAWGRTRRYITSAGG